MHVPVLFSFKYSDYRVPQLLIIGQGWNSMVSHDYGMEPLLGDTFGAIQPFIWLQRFE